MDVLEFYFIEIPCEWYRLTIVPIYIMMFVYFNIRLLKVFVRISYGIQY